MTGIQAATAGGVARLARAVRQGGGSRLEAVTALGHTGDPRAIPTLAAASRDRDPTVRASAIGALGRIVPRVLDALRSAVADESAASEQINMVVLQPISNAMSDPDPVVREAAAAAAGNLRRSCLTSHLVTCLSDVSAAVRTAAAASLVQFGVPLPRPVLTALTHDNPTVRDGARAVIHAIGADACASLTPELRAPHWPLRRAAAESLDALGWRPAADGLGAAYWLARGDWRRAAQIGEPAIPALVETLRLEDPDARIVATRALNTLGAGAVAPLLTMLAEPDAEARHAAAAALREMGDAATAPLVEALTGCRRVELGCLICELLGDIGDAQAVEPLIACAASAEPELQRSAVAALGRIGAPAALPTLSGCLSSLAWGVPQAAAQALGAIGNPSAVTPLASALNSRSAWTRRAAAEALGVLGGSQAVAALSPALSDASSDVRRASAIALGRVGATDPEIAERVRGSLTDSLSDADPAVRSAAAAALGELASPRSLEPLISALADQSPAVRHAIGDALEGMGGVAVGPLVEALRVGPADLRVRAAEILGRIGDRRATQPLIEMATSPEERLRRAAVLALGELGDPQAVEALIGCLSDQEDQVRASAAEAIGWVGAAEAVPMLVAALSDRSPGVRRAATTALIMACAGRG